MGRGAALCVLFLNVLLLFMVLLCSCVVFILLILFIVFAPVCFFVWDLLVYIFISLYFWLDTSNITANKKIPKRKYLKL